MIPGQAKRIKVCQKTKHCQGLVRVHLLPREQRQGGDGSCFTGEQIKLLDAERSHNEIELFEANK